MCNFLFGDCSMMNKKLPKLMNPRAQHGEAYKPTPLEHYANLLTHGWLVPFALVGVFHLCGQATSYKEAMVALLYGCAILALFTVSSSFHFISLVGKYSSGILASRTLKEVLHIGDRAVIYIFIASSYTPWLVLREYHDSWGRFTMWIVWSGAIFGISYQYIFHEKYKWLEIALYLVIAVCPAYTVVHMHEHDGVFELVVGGAIYIAGVVFFKLDGVVPCAHAIWHCFVFLGAFTHYTAVDKYLIGVPVVT